MASVLNMTSTRVGELACQRWPFLRELLATVVACDEVTVAPPTAAKQTTKAAASKKPATAPAETLYDIVLSDSLLFPVGGGQPCDYGTLHFDHPTHTRCCNSENENKPLPDCNVAKECAESVEVRMVQRSGSTCVLRCNKPLPVGLSVLTRVDWPRRLDHMQHHTGQHLLSAVLEREDMMGLPTVSWSLTHPYCFIQLDLTNLLSDAGCEGGMRC